MRKNAILALSLVTTPLATAGEPLVVQPQQPLVTEQPGPWLPIDVFRASATVAGGMDLDDGPGELEAGQFELRSLLTNRVLNFAGWSVLPVASYSFTSLDFSGTAAAFPIEDEDLHTIAVNKFFFRTLGDSPWLLGGWTRAVLSTDFQHINGDDFFFDAAAAVGYRFNKSFTLGVGAAVFDISGDPSVIPAVSFDWVVNDAVRVGLYGPYLIANYKHSDDWVFGIRGEPGGGVWNIRDAAGDSRTIDFSSYRLGINANRRLTEHLWLGAMAGVTLGNEIEVRNPGGGNRFKRDFGESFFAQLTLRLRVW